jgi:tetratricopeptide (TPR) repeat protein
LTEDYPELPEPYNNLAVLYASQGQYDKAKQSLEMAIRTHPSYATAHENLGDIYAKMASQAYDRALQLDRSNATTQTKLAMIQDLFASRSKAPATARSAPNTAVANAPESVKPGPDASKPASAEKGGAPSTATNNSDEVLKTVNAWAAAWSSKNVQKYLSFYADDFRTPGGENRSSWAATREERIKKPKSIQVGISNASVSFSDSNHATVKFRQSYRASHLKTSGSKTLLMVKSGSNWLIQEERAK